MKLFLTTAASDDLEYFTSNKTMPQDRTFVPGIDDASKTDFMYSRPSTSLSSDTANMNGTVIPGMMSQTVGNNESTIEVKKENQKVVSGLPVIGFLYSISNHGVPEYWPLVLGYNSIGRNPDNNVVLNERTVSGIHASIRIQKKRNDDVDAVILIEQGRTGVLLNDEDVDLQYGSRCKNGDVITIGSNYKFLVIIINAKASGLSIAENFMPYSTEVIEVPFPSTQKRTRTAAEPGTISFEGNDSFETPGSTRFM